MTSASAALATCRGGSARYRWRRGSPRKISWHTAPLSPRWAKSRSGTNFGLRISEPTRNRLGRYPVQLVGSARLDLPGLRALGGGLSLHVLAGNGDGIRGGQDQRWKATAAHRSRDDLAREREQQPRTFDHDQRVQIFLRHVHDTEHPGIGQVEAEHHLAGIFRLALDRKRHFEFVFGDIVGADIDLDIDRRLLPL